MKINIVLGHALPFPPKKGGGIENINFSLSKAFVKMGHQVVVYSRYATGLKRREKDRFGLEHIRVDGFNWTSKKPIDALNSFRWCLRLSREIEDADVTLFNTLFAFLILKKRRYGILASTIQRTPKWWVLRLFRNLDRVYCPSEAVLRQALSLYPNMKNLKRVYNCIEIPERIPSRSQNNREGLTFLYLGRFVRDKGLEYLVKGFSATLAEFPKNNLITMGPQTKTSGADEKFLMQMNQFVREKKAEDCIVFKPPIYDRQLLDQIIVDADVICIPTLWGETFSAAILEAMTFLKPVLVSDFGPMPEAVEHLKTGFISKKGDIDSIADGIRFFSRNAHRLKEFGLNARKKVEDFSAMRIAYVHTADFEDLLMRR